MSCAIVSALCIAAFCVAALVADGRRADRLERERHARARAKADRTAAYLRSHGVDADAVVRGASDTLEAWTSLTPDERRRAFDRLDAVDEDAS